MRYTLLGTSGLRVSELALGTMTFGETWGWGASQAESRAIFDRFVEAGGNFVDTSINYTEGTSEAFVGEFIQARRDALVVGTKYTLTRDRDDPNGGGNSRKNLVVSVETSLKHLQTDYIDLLWVHAWDFMTPVEEVMRGLDDLVRAGKVLYVGLSDSPAWVAARANMLAELRGWSPFVALQAPYALTWRDIERELLPMAQELDLTVTTWGLLDSGLLTGKYTQQADSDEPRRAHNARITPEKQQIIDTVIAVAEEVERSPAQVAINWIRQQQARASIIPILGARTVQQLEDNLAVLEWELTASQLQRLDEVSQIEIGFPYSFLLGGARPFIFGNTYERIHNHRR